MADETWADALKEQNAPSQENETAAADDDWAGAHADRNDGAGSGQESNSANFEELDDSGKGMKGSTNLNFLLDVPLSVTVELGQTSMIISKMLQLNQGSVVELNKAAGEPVEIYVNNRLLGKGEVIVVNERFGVRITEIISQADRIKNIG